MLSRDFHALLCGLQKCGRYLLPLTACSGWGAISHALSRSWFWNCSAPVNSFMLLALNNQPEGAALSPNTHWVCSGTAADFCQNPWLGMTAAQLRAGRFLTAHYPTPQPFWRLGCLNINFVLKEQPIFNVSSTSWLVAHCHHLVSAVVGRRSGTGWTAGKEGAPEPEQRHISTPEIHAVIFWWHWGV